MWVRVTSEGGLAPAVYLENGNYLVPVDAPHGCSVRRTETADAFAPRAIAAHVECRRAIPAGDYRSELETDGALPRPARSSTTQDSLRSKAELEGRRSERYRKSNPIHRNAFESSLLVHFSTASSICGQVKLSQNCIVFSNGCGRYMRTDFGQPSAFSPPRIKGLSIGLQEGYNSGVSPSPTAPHLL